jgi:large subunit ribosomal protein L6
MSRIGKQPILIPSEVTVTLENSIATVKGPKGTLSTKIPQKINVEIKDSVVYISRATEDRQTRANHGTTRALINNMIKGVVTPWIKQLEIRGTGYKAQVNGNKLKIWAGYINPREMEMPEGIFAEVIDETKVTISGCNKEIVGQIASNIRKIRKPEPYKGKGIRFLNEVIKIKAGKKAKA